jgi:competence protein ComEA
MIINKNLIREYFIFSKRERRGVIALSSIIIFVWCFYFLILFLTPEENWNIELLKNDLLALQRMQKEYEHSKKENYKTFYKKEKFGNKTKTPPLKNSINPNSLNFKEWMALGLSYKEAGTILNYKKKAGNFLSKKDLEKIKSIPKEKINLIIPLLQLPDALPINEISQKEDLKPEYKSAFISDEKKAPQEKKEKKKLEIFELNSCNSKALKQFDCLDSLMVQKIIQKRKALGGFISINQLFEIDSLPTSCLEAIKRFAVTDTSMIRKIDINSVTIKNLGRHPYIGYNIASALVNFRDKHGKFSGPNDLKKCMIMTNERIEKIKPYLEFNP